MSKKVLPVLALICFCSTTAVRDVLMEYLFGKNAYGEVSPQLTLFLFCIVAQVCCLLYLGLRGQLPKILSPLKSSKPVRQSLLWNNIFTLMAFLTYFLAIESPIGAGLNSLIAYATCPIFTVLAAAVFSGLKVDKKFVGTSVFCLAGISLFFIPRISLAENQSSLFLGLFFCMAGAFAGGFFRYYNKTLLESGLEKIPLLFNRLILCSIVLGVWSFDELMATSYGLMGVVGLAGFLGFFIPLSLTLYIIQKLNIKSYVLYMYMTPILTYFLSSFVGKTTMLPLDLIAGGFVLGSLIYYEQKELILSLIRRLVRNPVDA